MSPVTALLASTAAPTTSVPPPRPARPSLPFSPVPGRALAVECSSRPQKKATKHHIKSRPKKTQPWDIKRRPTQYPPLPQLPPDWTLVAAGPPDAATPAEEVEVEVVAAAAD